MAVAKNSARPVGKGKRTREAIIEQAIKIIAERGVGDTTVVDITDALGITNPNFYYYFENKDALLEVIGIRLVTDLAELSDGIAGEELMLRMISRPLIILEFADRNPHLLPILLHVLLDLENKHYDLIEKLRNDLEEGRDRGDFQFTDLDIATHFSRSLLTSAIFLKMQGNSHPQLNIMTAVHALDLMGIDHQRSEEIARRALAHIRRDEP